MIKYYHRGNGECVVPTIEEPNYQFISKGDTLTFDAHIQSLPIIAYCSPDTHIGWMEYFILNGDGELKKNER